MAVTASAITVVSNGPGSLSLTTTPATGGTGPYTYQWYMSQSPGFTPGPSNDLEGYTGLQAVVQGLAPGVTYYFQVVATDTGASNATDASPELTAVMALGNQQMNQFKQSPYLGMLDLAYNYNTIAAKMDEGTVGSFIAGQAVKVTQDTNGLPTVEPVTADSDITFGFINYNIKNRAFIAGSVMEISQRGNVMYLQANAAIDRGAQVMISVAAPGSVVTATSGKPIVGFAIDKATAQGQLIRVELTVPGYALLP